MPLIPKHADLLGNCANVKPGMNVLIVAAKDGPCGGVNIIDRETGASKAWRVSVIVANAMRAAGV